MNELIITQEEYDAINKAINEGDKVWENEILLPLKDRMKTFLREFQSESCCYCKRNTKGEFKMVLDIEHILPKKHYPDLMFKIPNLAVACKKCNMLIKGQDRSFVVDLSSLDIEFFRSEDYKFIHPNLDKYEEHLNRFSIEIDNLRFVKYIPKNEQKGRFTYEYFRLIEFEQDDLNVFQGIEPSSIDIKSIKNEIALKIMNL